MLFLLDTIYTSAEIASDEGKTLVYALVTTLH